MKQGWEIKKLGEVCRFINGRAYSKTELLSKGKYPVLRVGNFFTNNQWYYSDLELEEDKYCDNGDLLYAWSASFGPRIWEGEKVIYHYHIWKVEHDTNNISKEFLYQLLEWDTEALKTAHGTGTTMMHVGKGSIEKRLVPIPPLPEQQRIVSILDEAFAAIAKAKANAEQNLKNAKELFESYLQGVFENAGKKFKMVPIEDVCKLTRGHNPPKSQFIYEPKEGYVRFYQIRDGGTDDYAVYVPDTPKLHKVNEDELLMVAYRHIGRVFRGVSGAFNVALCKITNKDKSKLDNDYLFNIIPTDFVRGELLKRSERSLIPSMSVEHLKEIKIPLPPLTDQQTIVHQLDALRAKTQKLEAVYQKKIDDLEELKKSILQKAFSGAL